LSKIEFKSLFYNGMPYKFRTIAVCLAVFLGLCGFLMCFSMFSVLFGMGFFPGIVGRFFARSFGILSLLIPVYLGYAAFVLADPKWRPDRIFILSAVIFPFLTLAIGFAFIRDFEFRSAQFALLNLTGKTGFSLLIIFITVMEILALQVLKTSIFRQKAVLDTKINLLLPPGTVSHTAGAIEFNPEKDANKDEEDEILERLLKAGIDETYTNPQITSGESDLEEVGDIKNYDITIEQCEEQKEEQTEEELEGSYDIAIDESIDDSIDNPFDDSINDPIEDIYKLASEEDESAEEPAVVEGNTGVKRALEEAEAAAEVYAEQIRKKNAANSTRKKKYKIPVDILNQYPDGEYWVIDQATRDAAMALKETLEEFNIQAEVTGIRKGPVITLFEILPAPGVKLSKIVGLQDNIALRLAASSVRIVAPIPGKHAVGIEVPNAKRNIVSFREIIEEQLLEDKKMEIPVVMGKDISGEAQTIDLVQMPHLLIAGSTGSGKSVCVNSMILSILYQRTPAECRLILIDPKIVELKLYNDIPHLLTPVIPSRKKRFRRFNTAFTRWNAVTPALIRWECATSAVTTSALKRKISRRSTCPTLSL